MGLKLFKKDHINLVSDSYTFTYPNNYTMITFTSIENIFYLIYSNKENSIISYNLLDKKKINEIKKAHNKNIINFRHYLDINLKNDLIISISFDGNLKLWVINNLECLFNIQKAGFLYSACFLFENNATLIVTGNIFIKVYDLEGKIVRDISEPNDRSYIVESYFDKKMSHNFIITGNEDYIKSFDYNKNKLYHKYYDVDEEEEESIPHCSVLIYDKVKTVKLIESSMDGCIRIWDFHKGELLDKLKVGTKIIRGNNRTFHNIEILCSICFWDDKYLIAACNNSIKIIDLHDLKITKTIEDENVITVQKIILPKIGDFLISQGNENSI